jgi:Lon protease-like protein
MSEALDKVRGVRELPIFPLPVVLFPGVPLPLHIFEPRYRRMLSDIRAANNLFGLSYFNEPVTGDSRPPAGHVGCAAEVVEVQPLPEGRSNILTVGLARYRLEAYADAGEPYLVARVEFFEDDAEDASLLARRASEVSALFRRIARSVRALNDDRTAIPDLPEDEPERLSFLVAAAMELENDAKQELLELRSTAARLARVGKLLAGAVGDYERRASAHELARGNGHGRPPHGLDE